ncbi:MAG TPA: hypothetical protein VMQ54_11965 [Steroidobacteraceae bacterium]|nr:hypothetical protein [Steroidobacteraceae bacterium]
MQIFEMKTGRFTPLPDDVLAKFNDEQRAAYDGLASVVAELNAANVEVENSAAANRVVLSDLHAAEAAEAARPKHTFLDELRASQAQWRRDHQ